MANRDAREEVTELREQVLGFGLGDVGREVQTAALAGMGVTHAGGDNGAPWVLARFIARDQEINEQIAGVLPPPLELPEPAERVGLAVAPHPLAVRVALVTRDIDHYARLI